MTNTLTKNQRHTKIMKALFDFYKEDTDKLVRHLLDEKKYTFEDIAQILGVTKQAIQQKYK